MQLAVDPGPHSGPYLEEIRDSCSVGTQGYAGLVKRKSEQNERTSRQPVTSFTNSWPAPGRSNLMPAEVVAPAPSSRVNQPLGLASCVMKRVSVSPRPSLVPPAGLRQVLISGLKVCCCRAGQHTLDRKLGGAPE